MAKLVRDKIIQQIRLEGNCPEYEQVEGVDYAVALWAKLREEYSELEEAMSKQMGRESILEEMADVITVLEALSRNVFKSNIATIVEHKLQSCGGLDEGYILRGVNYGTTINEDLI